MKKLALSILTVILAAPVAASPLEVEKRIRDQLTPYTSDPTNAQSIDKE